MVVIVSGAGTQEARTPNRKLNPLRASIDDKIRADFCPRHPGSLWLINFLFIREKSSCLCIASIQSDRPSVGPLNRFVV